MSPVLYLVGFIGASLIAGTALACSCFPTTPENHILSTDAIFSGRVVAVEGQPPDYETCGETPDRCRDQGIAQIAVDQIFKGPTAEHFSVHFHWDGGTCGTSFTAGTDIIVFANVGLSGVVSTNLCTGAGYTDRGDLGAEYSRRLEQILRDRRGEQWRIDNNIDRPRSWFRSGLDLVELERTLNNQFGVLAAYEQMWALSVEQVQLQLWRSHVHWNPALDAALAALRVGAHGQAALFLGALRDLDMASPVSELLESYRSYRLGEESSIRAVTEWTGASGAQAGLLFSGSFRAGEVAGPDLRLSLFHGARLDGLTLVQGRVEDVIMLDSSFTSTSFRDSELERVLIDGAEFLAVGFSGAVITNSRIGNTTFDRASFEGAVIADSMLQNVSFAQYLRPMFNHPARLSRASFPGTTLDHVDLSFAVLLGADFSQAVFKDVDLQFARYDCETRWPERFEVARLPMIPVESDCGDRALIANFSNMIIDGDTDFRGLDLAGARFAGTNFVRSVSMRAASFRDANLTDADFALSEGSAVFYGSDLTNADFTNASIGGYRFRPGAAEDRPAILTGTRFRGAEMNLANFYDAEHPERSADLTAADLAGAIFTCRPELQEPMREIFLALDPASMGAMVSDDCPRQQRQ